MEKKMENITLLGANDIGTAIWTRSFMPYSTREFVATCWAGVPKMRATKASQD